MLELKTFVRFTLCNDGVPEAAENLVLTINCDTISSDEPRIVCKASHVSISDHSHLNCEKILYLR